MVYVGYVVCTQDIRHFTNKEKVGMTKSVEEQILAKLVNLESLLLKDTVASVSEINGTYGDPKISFDPRQWKGQSYKGTTASACPPEFLDSYAEALEWSANNPKPDQDPKRATYNRKDARLLRR